MNIAIVEDCAEDAKVLKDCIEKYAEKYNEVCVVNVYTDGVQFLTEYKSDADVVFMDIEMPYRDGLKVSAELRKTDPLVCIVFITNMRQYAIRGYEVEAFDFIVKPVTYDVFEFHFRRVVEKVRRNPKAEIFISTQGNKQRVSVRDIDYVEVVNHKVLFHLGDRVDIVPCAYQTDYWGDRYQSFHLKNLPVCIACPCSHPLAGKDRLSLPDLYGETVILSNRRGENAGRLAGLLEQTGKIRVEPVEYYDYNVFNRAVSANALIVSAECWAGVHPLLVTLPVDWDFEIPYGLIYPKEPREEVLQFIMAIGSIHL